jgi:hypothetical protein
VRDEFTTLDGRPEIENPKPSEMRDINRRLQSVIDEAPSDAVVELEVMREREGYKAMLKIFSSQARFVGGSRAGQFAEVIDEIFTEVRSQLHDWKDQRKLDAVT